MIGISIKPGPSWRELVLVPLLATRLTAPALAADKPSAATFPVATVRFEQNATDGDVEVVFEVTGRSDGLASLTVVAPDGRTVVDFRAADPSTLGIRQFVFESPEPKDVAGLKKAYPQGVYRFAGTTASGARLEGKAALRHTLPPTTAFLDPKADASNVAAEGLTIAWQPVEGVAGYILELEQDELHVNLTAKLPPGQSTFRVPDGFLRPGAEYQLGIGTVSHERNVSYVETHFTTAAR